MLTMTQIVCCVSLFLKYINRIVTVFCNCKGDRGKMIQHDFSNDVAMYEVSYSKLNARFTIRHIIRKAQSQLFYISN